jgi:uncharacterized protein with HEPN domain
MKNDRIYLKHILDAIAKINQYVSVGYDEFMARSHWQDATIRQLEIIGEATKQLSEDIRIRHPDVPWRRIAGMRDVLIHGYMGVDLEAVWEVTQQSLRELNEKVADILKEMEGRDA